MLEVIAYLIGGLVLVMILGAIIYGVAYIALQLLLAALYICITAVIGEPEPERIDSSTHFPEYPFNSSSGFINTHSKPLP